MNNPEIVCLVCGEVLFANPDEVVHCDCSNSTGIALIDGQWIIRGEDLTQIGLIKDGRILHSSEFMKNV